MRLSIQRLRWVLIAGALLLVVVLVAYIGYGRYRALKAYRSILERSGVHITHDTNGFTYSQSMQGKTIFTLHAKKATQLSDGKWSLHDADITLYGRIPDRPDHIYGHEFEYDEKEGVARAIGEVHMDLQAPQALAPHGDAKARARSPKPLITMLPAEDEHVIHVKTSGLVYLRKLGVAATDQQVELHYGGMVCTAQGAEFNTGQNMLRLLADVKMNGVTHEKPLHLTALHAEIDRTSDVATLAHPVVDSQGRTGKADAGTVNFESDGSIHRIQGFGNVVLSEGTRQITAAKLDAALNDDQQLKAVLLSGSVGMVDTDPIRPMQGSASQVDAAFTPKGEVTSVTASGGAHLIMVDHKGNPRGLTRKLEGTKIAAAFVPSTPARGKKAKTELREIHAVGAARASGESLAAPPKGTPVKVAEYKNTQVAADDLRVTFGISAEGKLQPQKLAGLGHTMLEQDATLGERETSSGDSLDVVFGAKQAAINQGPGINSALQMGHVVLRDQAATLTSGKAGALSDGTAQRAAYDGVTERLTLTGDVHWKSDSGQIIAPTVTVNQQTQDAEAEGGVQATLMSSAEAVGNSAEATKHSDAPANVTHILATSAQLHHATQLSEFRGTDAHPAKMWQGGSQVEAATLLFDGAKRSFSARPAGAGVLIHAVFASNPATPKPGSTARAASVVRVASPKMDYNDLRREATFTGGVTMEGSLGIVKGQRSVVFLELAEKKAGQTPQPATPQQVSLQQAGPSPFSGSLDRIVVLGDVQIQQTGRKGTGDELLYTAATGNYVLTGTAAKPPLVVDAQQGSVTGATLLFGDAGSTIVVAGDPGAAKKTRVRTETEVRQ
jgi:lipopolysaccharide export system protein LptA